MPVYLSVVAPLAGTAQLLGGFAAWPSCAQPASARPRRRDDRPLEAGRRAPGGRGLHRANVPAAVDGGRQVRILVKTLRRIVRARSLNPMRWYIIASANFHCFIWSATTPSPAAHICGGHRHARSAVFRAAGRSVGSGPDPLLRPGRTDRRFRPTDRLASAVRPGRAATALMVNVLATASSNGRTAMTCTHDANRHGRRWPPKTKQPWIGLP